MCEQVTNIVRCFKPPQLIKTSITFACQWSTESLARTTTHPSFRPSSGKLQLICWTRCHIHGNMFNPNAGKNVTFRYPNQPQWTPMRKPGRANSSCSFHPIKLLDRIPIAESPQACHASICPKLLVFNSVINCCGRAKQWRYSLHVLDQLCQMRHRPDVTWQLQNNMMIKSQCLKRFCFFNFTHHHGHPTLKQIHG